MEGEDDPQCARLTSTSVLPQHQKTSLTNPKGSSGVIHRLESNTASVKLTGSILTGLSDSEEEFTSSGDEYHDHQLGDELRAESHDRSREHSGLPDETSHDLCDNVNISQSDQTGDERENSCSSSQSEEELRKDYEKKRFNPFDNDIHIDEDYFNTSTTADSNQHQRKQSETSSSWTNLSDDNSADITYADLGLAEDHFSHPEGHFGLSSTEEMEMAIENCKEMILNVPQDSDKQKNLVQKLVQLRLKLQEIKEGPLPVEEDVKLAVGHRFKCQTSSSTKHYCEKCNTMILGVIQTWYKCTECGYSAHEKCLNMITRTCASLKVLENPTYTNDICPTRGLSFQNYRCAECRAPISFKPGFCEPRLCDYSGNYYCEMCHWNDTMVIPARVLHNWDFEPRKVCRAAKQYLKLMITKAAMQIQDVNPMLFSFVDEINEIKKLREEILIMKKYLLVCDDAMKQKFLLLLQDRQHFVENWDTYSMKDLLEIQSDVLLGKLVSIHAAWAQHIKTDCQKCQAKGFICELCDSREILFPFDNIAVVCAKCSYVLHRHCFARRGAECPRCDRRNKRKAN